MTHTRFPADNQGQPVATHGRQDLAPGARVLPPTQGELYDELVATWERRLARIEVMSPPERGLAHIFGLELNSERYLAHVELIQAAGPKDTQLLEHFIEERVQRRAALPAFDEEHMRRWSVKRNVLILLFIHTLLYTPQ